MGLLLVPASRENIMKSIEKPVSSDFALNYLSKDFINSILQKSGNEGIRCWAVTRPKKKIFDDMQLGDEVLLSESRTGLFTHYGIIIGKAQNVDFGNALWPFAGELPWEYIYFLANITKVNINKSDLVVKLGYKANYVVPGPIRLSEQEYKSLGPIFEAQEISIFEHIAETIEDLDFSSADIRAMTKRRVGQTQFSKEVKTNYNYSCAICGIKEPEFLIAGHILPWAEDEKNRKNPANGICFCALHDKAFEYGYISIDDNYKILVSSKIKKESVLYQELSKYEKKDLACPNNAPPDKSFLKKHRERHGI